MGLIPLGILSSAGGGFGTYELIQTTILGSDAASVTFSGLDAYSDIYDHLQIRWTYRGTNADLYDGFLVRFNGNTTTTYTRHRLFGGDSAITSNALTTVSSIGIAAQMGGTGATSAFSSGVMDILDPYSTTKNKTIRALTGRLPGASERFVNLTSGVYRQTTATSSISLTGESGNIAANSRFSIYGIR
jgi:hypothetical protein